MQEKYTGRCASSRRFVQKIGEMTFFCGRCNTGEDELRRNASRFYPDPRVFFLFALDVEWKFLDFGLDRGVFPSPE